MKPLNSAKEHSQNSIRPTSQWLLAAPLQPAPSLRLVRASPLSSETGRRRFRRVQQTRVYPYPLVAGSPRPNSKMGAPDPENPLFPGFSGLRGGPRPWSQTMVSEGARPWGRGRSGDCKETVSNTEVSEFFLPSPSSGERAQ